MTFQHFLQPKLSFPVLSEVENTALEKYEEQITLNGCPVIYSVSHFAALVGHTVDFIYGVTNKPSKFYRTFAIQKKSGFGSREISAPLPNLMIVQRFILHKILNHIKVDDSAKAFKKKSSIKDAARLHRRQKILLKCDVKNFFGSIEEWRIISIFFAVGYTKELSIVLAKLCTLNGFLPQGAPTSGSLSNILLISFDRKMLKFCKRLGLRYTRYADDICISGERLNTTDVFAFVGKLLADYGLVLNPKKNRVLRQNNRMIVVGIVVNEKMSAPKELRQSVRQEFYYIKKYGLHEHCSRNSFRSPEYELERLIGQISHIENISFRKEKFLEMRNYLLDLRMKHFAIR